MKCYRGGRERERDQTLIFPKTKESNVLGTKFNIDPKDAV